MAPLKKETHTHTSNVSWCRQSATAASWAGLRCCSSGTRRSAASCRRRRSSMLCTTRERKVARSTPHSMPSVSAAAQKAWEGAEGWGCFTLSARLAECAVTRTPSRQPPLTAADRPFAHRTGPHGVRTCHGRRPGAVVHECQLSKGAVPLVSSHPLCAAGQALMACRRLCGDKRAALDHVKVVSLLSLPVGCVVGRFMSHTALQATPAARELDGTTSGFSPCWRRPAGPQHHHHYPPDDHLSSGHPALKHGVYHAGLLILVQLCSRGRWGHGGGEQLLGAGRASTWHTAGERLARTSCAALAGRNLPTHYAAQYTGHCCTQLEHL